MPWPKGKPHRPEMRARMLSSLVRPLEERFSNFVHPEPNSGCWLWLGVVNGAGYGRVGLGSREQGMDFAHRVSFRLHKGEIPSGQDVCHSCDTPLCVNPDHLFLGSRKVNMRDCASKGRVSAKLSRPQVLAIRAALKSGRLQKDLAEEYGVHPASIKSIKSGRTWCHVQET